ncbi:MAG: ATP-binding protein [Bacteroidales bacterium]|nr:ATP-binding protein [Bacteroidales bacterium]
MNNSSELKKKFSFSPKDLNIREIIGNTTELFEQDLRLKNINISMELSLAVVVHADQEMLSAILRNLLSNAIKFSEMDSMIIIRTFLDDIWFCLEIEDFGIGMDERIKNKILSKSIVPASIDAKNDMGVGMGLALSKEFILNHDGLLEIHSIIGEGTTVKIKLPLNQTK